jgi:hypothetical protein
LGRSIGDGLLGNVPPWGRAHDLGSIAGTMPLGMGRILRGLPRPNDGTVTVEETRFDGMKDHALIHASHFGMLLAPGTVRLCHNFIRDGRFGSL